MPITVKHGADPGAVLAGSFAAGRGRRDAELGRIGSNIAQQNIQREDQQQFGREMFARNQLAAAQSRDFQKEMTEGQREFQKEMQAESFRMKTDSEKQQIKDRAVEYQAKRKQIEDAYASGRGQITDKQYNEAMQTLQDSYASGDVDVTSPFYSQIEKQRDLPMVTLDSGEKVYALLDKDGNPDYGKTALEYYKKNQKAMDVQEKKRDTEIKDEVKARLDDIDWQRQKAGQIEMGPIERHEEGKRLRKQIEDSDERKNVTAEDMAKIVQEFKSKGMSTQEAITQANLELNKVQDAIPIEFNTEPKPPSEAVRILPDGNVQVKDPEVAQAMRILKEGGTLSKEQWLLLQSHLPGR